MHDWDTMTIARFRSLLNKGEVEPLDWWRACRSCIETKEKTIQAWEYLAPEPDTHDLTTANRAFALAGVPVGIKDIIDTRDMPTTWGTGYHRVESTDMDAAVVSLLRRHGALAMGKTVSTEYAYFQPNKTRNPYDPLRTPGGSSSGSAAAVASGMVPVALGTQTVGSIIRPASYCGVVGFKPTHGTLSIAGLKALGPSMDTLGWFTRTVSDCQEVFSTLTQSSPVAARQSLQGVRFGVCPIPTDSQLSKDAAAALSEAAIQLTDAGAVQVSVKLDPLFDSLINHQQVILAYEASRALASEHERFKEQMSPTLLSLLAEGDNIPLSLYLEARQATEKARHLLSSYEVDVFLAPSSMDSAPPGLEKTGDPLFSRAWTLLGVPCLSLPLYTTCAGLPLGVQLIAHRYQDEALLEIAAALTR